MFSTSILERLIDEEPTALSDIYESQMQVISRVNSSICRDLETLFNTPKRYSPLPGGLSNLIPSVVDYGVPGFFTNDMSTSNKNENFLHQLKLIIMCYEPRIHNPSLYIADNYVSEKDNIKFHISGSVIVFSKMEYIKYNGIFNHKEYNFLVKDEGGFQYV